MSKTLIAGGAGYIGGCLSKMLLDSGHDVTVLDNLTYEKRFLNHVPFIFMDVQDTNALDKIIHEYDNIIWLAAIVGDNACNINPVRTQQVNSDSIKWLVDNYDGKILFASTCSVYGCGNVLLDELSSLQPLSLYAKTKLSAEQYITQNSNRHLVYRIGTLFGQGDYYSRVRFDLVVNFFIAKAFKHEPICLFGGNQWRPILHVKDAADAFIFGLENDLTGVYNISYKNYQIKDIALEIREVFKGIDIKKSDDELSDERNYRISIRKMNSTDWKAKYNLNDGIMEIYTILKEGRIKNPQDINYSNALFLKKNGFHS